MYSMCIIVNGESTTSPIRFSSMWAATISLDDWACVTNASAGYVISNETGEIVHEWKPW